MTELEMSMTLGIISEPEKNRIEIDPLLYAEIMYLREVFDMQKCQKAEIGRLNKETWAELLPWHSLN